MISVIDRQPPPPKPAIAGDAVSEYDPSHPGWGHTSASDEHVHVLCRSTDRRANSKDEDESKENRFATKTGDEVADEGNNSCGRDSEGAADPDKVRAVEVTYDRRECSRHGHLRTRPDLWARGHALQ